jgi:hypothetical protein
MAGDQDLPVAVPGHHPPAGSRLAVWADIALGTGAAVGVGACVTRVGQDLVHGRVGGSRPGQLAVSLAGQLEVFFAQPQPHLPRRAGGCEALEHRADGAADRLVRVQQDLPGPLAPDQPGRQLDPQLAAGSLAAQPAEHPGPQHLELCLGHGALEAQQEPVIEHAGMVDAGLVGDQGVGDPAQIEQAIPLGRGAGQPGDLQRQHDPDLPERYLHGQLGEPGTGRQPGPADTQVSVDDTDRRARPAKLRSPSRQVVLAQRGLTVALNLDERGLAAVDDRRAGKMGRGDLGAIHLRPPLPASSPPRPPAAWQAAPRRRSSGQGPAPRRLRLPRAAGWPAAVVAPDPGPADSVGQAAWRFSLAGDCRAACSATPATRADNPQIS